MTIYFTDISSISGDRFIELLATMPPAAQRKIEQYTVPRKRYQRTAGSILLAHVLQLHARTAVDIDYSPVGKPGIPGGPAFSLAYSGDIIICVCGSGAAIGIDIEELKDVEKGMAEDYFTRNEQAIINASADMRSAFYTMWVRKEALLKAVGTGVVADLSAIDVAGDAIIYAGQVYYLRNIPLRDGYAACVASDKHITGMQLTQVYL